MNEVGDPAVTAPSQADVEAALGTGRRLGSPVRVHPVAVTVESLALQWARQHGAPEGALVVVEHELSGRVRRAIPWVSQPGRSLAFSVVLRPDLPPAGEGLLWLLASLAAAEGVAAAAGLDARLKWPNDVLVGDARLGGVRVDAHLGPGRVEVAVLTVRLNVGGAAEQLALEGVTTLAATSGPVERLTVLRAVLDRLESRSEQPVAELLEGYRARCSTLGRQVVAELLPSGEARGRAVDVSATGALVLEAPGRQGEITIGQVARLQLS